MIVKFAEPWKQGFAVSAAAYTVDSIKTSIHHGGLKIDICGETVINWLDGWHRIGFQIFLWTICDFISYSFIGFSN